MCSECTGNDARRRSFEAAVGVEQGDVFSGILFLLPPPPPLLLPPLLLPLLLAVFAVDDVVEDDDDEGSDSFEDPESGP